jgi:pimeloyl-ACP methyl ester carboxylesterase/ubiquinone/menaquinone biosynthesis C-methylase UbiE
MSPSPTPIEGREHETQRRRAAGPGGLREQLLAGLPVSEQRLRLAGVSTAVLEGGDGPPIVLLHGPGEYGAKWLRVIPGLARSHRVIAPDLPGHGESEPFEGPPDIDRVIAWLDDLIEYTCRTSPALVGQTVGGAIAAHYAGRRGERLSGLVLSDALGLRSFQPAPEFGLALTAFLSEPTDDTHDRLWSRCAFDLAAMRERMGDKWEQVKAYNLDRAQVPHLASAQGALMERYGIPPISPANLARIDVSTTLIWGRYDLATPLSVAEDASARYGWPLYVIDKAADDPAMEQPEAFIAALRSALQGGGRMCAIALGREESQRAWNGIAAGYNRTVTPTHLWLGHEGLRHAGLLAGMRMVDVAAGSGALAIPAARLGARVLAIDQSPVMLGYLRARTWNEGLEIETRVMDGHALELADNTFDLAGSQFGVMLFEDMPRGLREMARVVVPGGRVLINAFGDPQRIEFLRFLVEAVQTVRPQFSGPPMSPPPLEFQLSDPQRLRRELAAVGLKNITVQTITETTEFESGQALWDWLVSSNPLAERMLGSLALSEDERSAIRTRLERMVRGRAGRRRTARLTSPINVAIGTK